MNKRLLRLLTFLLFVSSPFAEAQQPDRIPRIGFLTGAPLSAQNARNEAFRQSLRELGYVEAKNIVIEWQSYEGKEDLRSTFAAELVRLKVDVIVAGGSGDIRAAKEATGTIPIIMLAGGDAVGSGFIASLARPGGNITGFSTLRPEFSGKRLELLKETLPMLSRVAFIASPQNRDYLQELKEVELAAGSFGLKIQRLDIRGPEDIETAFQAAVKGRAVAVEQPTKFEFVVNLKAAKQLDLTIPPNVLARADKVIR